MITPSTRTCIAVVIVGALVAGCSSADQPGLDFWTTLGGEAHGLEVDPPRSIEDLVAKSDTVARGRVVGVEKGPTLEFDSGDPQLEPLVIPSVVLEVLVSRTLVGEPDKTLRVWVSTESQDTARSVRKSLPEDEYVWFVAEEDSQDGLVILVSRVGVLGETAKGVVAPLDPVAVADVVDARTTRLADVESVVAAAGRVEN